MVNPKMTPFNIEGDTARAFSVIVLVALIFTLIGFIAGTNYGAVLIGKVAGEVVEGSEFTIDVDEAAMAESMVNIFCKYGATEHEICDAMEDAR